AKVVLDCVQINEQTGRVQVYDWRPWCGPVMLHNPSSVLMHVFLSPPPATAWAEGAQLNGRPSLRERVRVRGSEAFYWDQSPSPLPSPEGERETALAILPTCRHAPYGF